MLVGRRGLLKGALASGVALAGGSLLYRGLFHLPPAAGLLILTESERDTLAAMADVYFPGGDGMPSWQEVDVIGFADRYIAAMPGRLGRLTKLLIQSIEWGAVPGTSELSRFSKLTRAGREEIVDAWETSKVSPRRLGFVSLKLTLAMGYFEDDRVRREMGWYMSCRQIAESDGMEEWL